MKFWTKGTILILICLAVTAGSVFALYKELTDRISKNSADSIGTITFKKKNAERKYSEYVIWEDITSNSPVYNYDSLRTFKGSAAYIKLKNGAEISLDEDTMIVLIVDEKGLKINFDSGSISAKSGGSSENISLNTKDVSISMKKGELAVKKGKDSVDVNVSSGTAAIDAGGGDIKKIDSNTSAQITNGKTEVKKVSVLQEFPSDHTFFVTYKNTGSIDLKWKSDSSSEETVQISKDSGFSDIVYTKKTSGRNLKTDIQAGDYYWRIVSGSGSSSIRKFTMLKDSTPELIYPGINEKVSVAGDEESVNFKWSRSEYVSAYEFELANEQNPDKPIKKLKTIQNTFSVESIPAGSLSWKVNRIYPDGFVVLDNKVYSNRFNLERTIFTRVRPKPLHDGEMQASTLSENIIFNWESGKGIKNYTVDLSFDSDFKNKIKSSTVTMSFYNSGKLPEGRYYWRVTANYEKGEPLVSETVPLVVTPPKPVINLTPDNGSTFPASAETLKFSWKDPSDVRNYSFEVSADSDFRKIITSSKTDITNHILKNPGQGKFYWRVSIIDKTGTYIAKGEPRNFIIAGSLQKPSNLSPSNMSSINLDNTDVIKFHWDKVAGADSYELEIFQNVSGIERSLIVLKTNSPKSELRNFAILNPGKTGWVVRAKKTVDGKISATSESDHNYFILKVNDNIPAAKLKVVDKIYVK